MVGMFAPTSTRSLDRRLRLLVREWHHVLARGEISTKWQSGKVLATLYLSHLWPFGNARHSRAPGCTALHWENGRGSLRSPVFSGTLADHRVEQIAPPVHLSAIPNT